MQLSNDAKIRACNFYHAMQRHMGICDQCCEYLYDGDGDLCNDGKEIIAREMAYVDTTPELSVAGPSNGQDQGRRASVEKRKEEAKV